jgi:hypothetical protein
MLSAETLRGNSAYQAAMDNLRATWSFPFTPEEYPGRYFHYGEGGRGLILSGNLVYVSSEEAEDIRAIDGEIKIGTDLYLVNPHFKSIRGVIPPEVIDEVVAFSKQVRDQAVRES